MFVHPWDMMGTASMPKYWLPWLVGMPAEQSRAACCLIFGGVLERLPKLRIAWPTAAAVSRHHRPHRARLQHAPGPGRHRQPGQSARLHQALYFDSWVADPRALQYLLDTVGTDRVMLGTDYPFPLGEQEPGAGIAALDLDPTGQARLYHGTALEWLGLPASRFA